MPLRVHEEICVFYKKLPEYHPQLTKGEPSHSRGAPKPIKNNNYGKFSFMKTRENSDMKFPKSIITIPKIHASKTIHPTQKPVELIEWLIKTYTSEGQTVLDFAMGSGTTMVACLNTGRNGIGIEIDEKYFEIANKAVNEWQKQEEIEYEYC